jgi:flagellin-like protein
MGSQTSTPPETPDDGISPVVGAILMVAITIVLAAVLLFFVTGLANQPQIASAGFQIEETQSGVEILLNSVGTADSITLVVDGTPLHTWQATDVGTSVTVTGVTTDSEISLVGENEGSETVIQLVSPDRAHGAGAPALVPNAAPTPSGPTVLWEYEMDDFPPLSGVTIDDNGKLYANGINTSTTKPGSASRLHAVNLADGSESWVADPGVRSFYAPIYHNGIIYYTGRYDDLTAFDHTTGTPQFTVSRDQLFGKNYISDNYIATGISYGFSTRGVQVYDTTSGSEVHITNYGQPVSLTGIDDTNNRIYGYNYTPGMVEIEASTGTVVTFHDLSGHLGPNDDYIVDGTTVYGSDTGTIVKYDMNSATLDWSVPFSLNDPIPGRMHAADGSLYYSDSNILRVYSTADGSDQYTVSLDSYIKGAIHATDGNVYVTTQNTLYSLSDVDGSENWNMTFTNEHQSAPNVYNGVVYIITADTTNTEGTIYAIEVGGSATADTEDCGRGQVSGGFAC